MISLFYAPESMYYRRRKSERVPRIYRPQFRKSTSRYNATVLLIQYNILLYNTYIVLLMMISNTH